MNHAPKAQNVDLPVVGALDRKGKKKFFPQRKPQWTLNEFYFLTYEETPRGLFSPKIVSGQKAYRKYMVIQTKDTRNIAKGSNGQLEISISND